MKITIEPLEIEAHLDTVHAWVTHPRSAYWMMLDASVDDVAEEHARIARHPHHDAWLGRVDGEPAFLVETYDPARSELGGIVGLPELAPGDLGMHVLVAPAAGEPTTGFTTRIFRAVMRHCFADPGVRRVVVEPDVRNLPIRRKNTDAGFVELREVDLGEKTAMLSVCTREMFAAAHLRPENLRIAHRHLVAKAIAEFSHERMIAPVAVDGGADDAWELQGPSTTYVFTARRFMLDHWVVDPASIVRRGEEGEEAEVDAQAFVAEFAPALGIPATLLPTYLEELAATIASSCWKLEHQALTAADLVEADHQSVEGAMSEGHPAFVANNGRIGFDIDDHARWAPETSNDLSLLWVAVAREQSHLALGRGEDEQRLYAAELGEATLARFAAKLRSLELDPDGFRYVPVHPWQWRHKLAVTFATDVAARRIVLVGEGEDAHRPQQSIRTYFNTSRPERHYVKTALSIQNMGFMRGLSPAYMAATPVINDWVADLVEGDAELKERGFGVLRELASVGWTGDVFHALPDPSPYRKMIAALWRESPVPRLAEGERCATMAALLHRDASGASYAAELVRASGLPAREWVRAYLDAYLRPLVHCLMAYDLAFMPHGENLVMVLQDHVPVRMFMKDIGEEVAVMGDLPLPEEVARIRGEFPDDVKALAVHTDIFDGVLRYVAAILDDDGVLPETEFWAQARACIVDHAADHPELADAAARYDFLRPRFRHSCLNRLQLRNTLQMVDITDQAESLMFAGTLANPVA
ncbi:siderophore synthetase component [Nocardioides albertanoniae]|uniref:Lysine N-acyltransferase MbtK n=1 Tax=Nocardioides albertanoniae TaxID=1175486 RepID=A0A543A5L6_9ACTN|nr:GNAT family N-acetyltransferase [Nocardioides albertanoniae]TQL67848.1 siderophore synthetase component [Nocardioides albertanoniae]